MSKKFGLFLVFFSVAYFIYITTVAGHGIMVANVFSSALAFIIGMYYLSKSGEDG
jgi:hypothetical protein